MEPNGFDIAASLLFWAGLGVLTWMVFTGSKHYKDKERERDDHGQR